LSKLSKTGFQRQPTLACRQYLVVQNLLSIAVGAVMQIVNAISVRSSSPNDFAWRELRRFQNSDFVTTQIMNLKGIDKKHYQNVQKQARQLGLCLSLAQDYFAAASQVSLVTKPVLLYYATMHLALSEILFKQLGDSSLDRARKNHKHHGLISTIGSIKNTHSIQESASLLKASPMIDGKENRLGTFELWRKSAQQHPWYGIIHNNDESTNRSGCTTYVGIEEGIPELPKRGITLLDCLGSGLITRI
jgi:hypothetical protein